MMALRYRLCPVPDVQNGSHFNFVAQAGGERPQRSAMPAAQTNRIGSELHVVITALMPVNELLQSEGHVAHLHIAALAQLVRHVTRYILRPSIGSVECDDSDRVLVFPGEHPDDHCP
jgi:hypothetical protein